MKSKVFYVIIIFTAIFAIVSALWVGDGSRQLDFYRLEKPIESMSSNSYELREDFEYISAIVEIVQYCYIDFDGYYDVDPSSPREADVNNDGYFYLTAYHYNNDYEVIDSKRITTSYTLDQYEYFQRFCSKVERRLNPFILALTGINAVDKFFIPDDFGLDAINQIIESTFSFFANFYIGGRLVICFIPIFLDVLVDSLSVIKDFVILPFRLLF